MKSRGFFAYTHSLLYKELIFSWLSVMYFFIARLVLSIIFSVDIGRERYDACLEVQKRGNHFLEVNLSLLESGDDKLCIFNWMPV